MKPSGVVINVSDYCPSRCRFCYIWKRQQNPEELKIEDWKRFIWLIREWVERPFKISFTGGEPLLREGIVDLISFAHENDFKTYVTTSGNGLNSGKIKELSAAGLDTVCFSLETLDPQKHDNLRGVSGLFDNILNCIEQIIRADYPMKVGINTIIMRDNLEDIPKLTKWVLEDPRIEFIGYQAITQPQNSPCDKEWFKRPEFTHLWPDDHKRVESVLDEVIRTKKDKLSLGRNKIGSPIAQLEAFKAYFKDPNNFVKEIKCAVYKKPVCINPYGRIEICQAAGELMNIKEDNFLASWDYKMRNCIEKISKCKTPCPSLINCYFEDAPIDRATINTAGQDQR